MRLGTGLAVALLLLPWPLMAGPDNWWAFVLVTAAILAAMRLLFGPDWREAAGLRMSAAEAVLAVMAFLAIAAASRMLLHHVYQGAGVRADAPGIKEQAGFLFQAFNEEIFFRALLIGLVIQYVRPAVLVSLGLALVFAGAHFLLYRYSNPMHLALSPMALATLFLAGVAMNNLYLAFRHIGFSWALHAGWNMVWLPASFHDAASGAPLYEPQIFDRVLGAPIMAGVAGAAAALTFLFLARRARGRRARRR